MKLEQVLNSELSRAVLFMSHYCHSDKERFDVWRRRYDYVLGEMERFKIIPRAECISQAAKYIERAKGL